MCFHRDFTDAKFVAHLFIQKTGDHYSKNLALARSEAGISRFQSLELGIAIDQHFAPLNGTANSREERAVIDGLRQKLHSPGLHGLYGLWNVAVPRYEDNWHFRLLHRQPFLQLQSIQTGH